MVNPLSSAPIISLWITLLIVVGGARLFGVKLNRRHALPIMTVMGAGLTLVAPTESDQLPLSTMSL